MVGEHGVRVAAGRRLRSRATEADGDRGQQHPDAPHHFSNPPDENSPPDGFEDDDLEPAPALPPPPPPLDLLAGDAVAEEELDWDSKLWPWNSPPADPVALDEEELGAAARVVEPARLGRWKTCERRAPVTAARATDGARLGVRGRAAVEGAGAREAARTGGVAARRLARWCVARWWRW
jgi:hypothetical protein